MSSKWALWSMCDYMSLSNRWAPRVRDTWPYKTVSPNALFYTLFYFLTCYSLILIGCRQQKNKIPKNISQLPFTDHSLFLHYYDAVSLFTFASHSHSNTPLTRHTRVCLQRPQALSSRYTDSYIHLTPIIYSTHTLHSTTTCPPPPPPPPPTPLRLPPSRHLPRNFSPSLTVTCDAAPLSHCSPSTSLAPLDLTASSSSPVPPSPPPPDIPPPASSTTISDSSPPL